MVDDPDAFSDRNVRGSVSRSLIRPGLPRFGRRSPKSAPHVRVRAMRSASGACYASLSSRPSVGFIRKAKFCRPDSWCARRRGSSGNRLGPGLGSDQLEPE